MLAGLICRPRHTPKQLAGLLYDSLHEKLPSLADNVLVYPAHGAGSLCGKNMRADRSSTIGTERLTNYALQIKSREEFIAQLTSNLPARPDYFLKDAEINRTGAAALSDLPPLRAIAPSELKTMLAAGEIALDCADRRRVRGRSCARIGKHRAGRAVCVMGRDSTGIVGASGADCGIGHAVGRGAAATDASRHRRGWTVIWTEALMRGSKQGSPWLDH